jgi:RhtB (resistance to homoserine/threonine) family protein
MFGTHNYLVFLFSGILLNITPGQDTIYIIGRSIAQGRKAGILSVFGIGTGALCHTLITALGLAALIKVSPIAFDVIQYSGSAYLIYLGARSLFRKNNIFDNSKTGNDTTKNSKIFLQGFLTNLLNPKVALFFLAFLPQFVNPANNYGVLTFLFLGFTFITTGSIWCLIVALFSSYLTRWLRNDKKISIVLNKACGVLFIVLGLNILFYTR